MIGPPLTCHTANSVDYTTFEKKPHVPQVAYVVYDLRNKTNVGNQYSGFQGIGSVFPWFTPG